MPKKNFPENLIREIEEVCHFDRERKEENLNTTEIMNF